MGVSIMEALRRSVRSLYVKIPTELSVSGNKLFLSHNGTPIDEGIEYNPSGGTGGGSVGYVTLKNLLYSSNITAAYGSTVELKFSYTTTEETDDGSARVYLDDVLKSTSSIKRGENSIDITKYLRSGTNNIKLTCVDPYGNERSLKYTVSIISLSLITSFSDAKPYTGDYFEVPYVLTADGVKVMHFEFDGEDITETISSSGTNSKQTIYFGTRGHGVYTLKMYAEMEISGATVTSEVYYFDVMRAIGTTPLISSACSITNAKQYETINIPFAVYHSTDAAPVVDLIISQNDVNYFHKSMAANRGEQVIWPARTSLIGDVTFTISYEGVTKSHVIAVAESDISISVRQNDMAFELTAAGKSNNDTDKDVWISNVGDVSVDFENVGWNVQQKTFIVTGADSGSEIKKKYAIGTGWTTDDNGNTALRLSGDARATINFQPFAEDWTTSKTIEMEFAIRDVNNRDAVAISCMNNNVGFKITADTASLIRNNVPIVEAKYVDDEKIHLAFVVEKQVMSDHTVRLVTSYLNGVLSSAATFAESDSIFQNPAVNISVGSSDCSLDLYMIRFYDVALTSNELRDNYIADNMDVDLLADNDVYVNGAIEYSKLESKIPVMRITGETPSKKADSNPKKGGRDYPVDVIYTNKSSIPSIREDDVLIHVQGTSSEGYIRKNWDLDFANKHQHMENQLPTDYYTMKADYAEATGTHNTGNANYVHTFYTSDRFGDKPPFNIDPLARSTIAGFPCVIFHRKTESDPYTFAGKYNFNFSKNSENVFGFTATNEDGTPVYPKIQSWEFCENKYLACRFRQDPDASDVTDDSWKEWFDDRYLYDGGDMEDFKIMYRWVYSTCQDNATGENLVEAYVDVDGVTHTQDTKEYRLAKFKTEFEEHFDLDFSLVYYLYTFVMLMCDQRAKNMFLTSWDGIIWSPWLYDNDTCLGINNEGYLRYDYYHEDLGQNDAVGATNVYNGYDSVLWNNFSEAFKDEIQKTYSAWRSGNNPLLSYDNVMKYFITDQSDKWCISIYNEDAEYKYLSMYRNGDDSSFLYQVKGTGEEHLKYFIKNRLMYCDSKWQAGDFINKDTNTILLRLNSPDGIEDEEIKPNMNIKFKTFSNMYTGVRYGTNGALIPRYTDRGQLVEHPMPEGEDPNNLDTYIFGASEISEIEDLSLLYPNLINISAASKLTKVVVGNNHPNYNNDVLKTISFSNNRLLREVNVCNCTGLTITLDFSLCPDIQYIYATGSKISGVQLPDAGFLKVIQLPETVSNLTFINQHHIEEFVCEGYGNVTTIKIENSDNMPLQDILLGCDSSVLASVSIKNIDWDVDSEANLKKIIDKLIACNGSVVEGSVYLPKGITVSDSLKVRIHQNFPNLNVIDDNPVFYIDYYNFDNTIWDTEMVDAGNDAKGPQKGDPDDIIQEVQGLRHLFIQWKVLPIKVNKNYQVDATWQTQYAIKYYDAETLLYEYWVNQGNTAKDPVLDGSISIPEKTGTNDLHYAFDGWDNLPTNIQKAATINAVWTNLYPVRFYATESSTTPHYVQWVKDGESAYDPIEANECAAPGNILTEDITYVFSKWTNIPTNVTAITNVYAVYSPLWAVRFYNGYMLEDTQWIPTGSSAVDPVAAGRIIAPTRASTAQHDYTFFGWEGDYTNVTEARKIMAIYTATIRKYNVYFYNGDELLQTVENVPYGSSTAYTGSTPVKTGVHNPEEYVFKGWIPAPEKITGETECYALFKFTGYLFGKLSDDSEYGTVDNPNWDKINSYWGTIGSDVESYKNGLMSEEDFDAKYQIGGRMIIPIELSDGVSTVADIEIISRNHDDLADGSGKAALTFFCKDLPNLLKAMNESSSDKSGWETSAMRNFVNGELLAASPDHLKAIVKPVLKISDGGADNKTLVTTTDSYWLASYDEVGFNTNNYNLFGQGELYSSVFSTNKETRKKYIVDNTETGGWWLRSSYYTTSGNAMFWRVQKSGASYGDIPSGLFYVAFGFCV